ncbi:MAG: amino acid permease, partial [Bacillota bacterium]|nr:amino acid permease [Bacillota bacterium]
LFSGIAMLLGLGFGLLFPRVYLVLITTSGFTLIFTYAVIMASHIRFRKRMGCPPEGKCQMPGFPYTSWIALISMIIVLLSMPFIPGQTIGLISGVVMVIIFSMIYYVMRFRIGSIMKVTPQRGLPAKSNNPSFQTEFSHELAEKADKKKN